LCAGFRICMPRRQRRRCRMHPTLCRTAITGQRWSTGWTVAPDRDLGAHTSCGSALIRGAASGRLWWLPKGAHHHACVRHRVVARILAEDSGIRLPGSSTTTASPLSSSVSLLKFRRTFSRITALMLYLCSRGEIRGASAEAVSLEITTAAVERPRVVGGRETRARPLTSPCTRRVRDRGRFLRLREPYRICTDALHTSEAVAETISDTSGHDHRDYKSIGVTQARTPGPNHSSHQTHE
jgi:hypothetical protein